MKTASLWLAAGLFCVSAGAAAAANVNARAMAEARQLLDDTEGYIAQLHDNQGVLDGWIGSVIVPTQLTCDCTNLVAECAVSANLEPGEAQSVLHLSVTPAAHCTRVSSFITTGFDLDNGLPVDEQVSVLKDRSSSIEYVDHDMWGGRVPILQSAECHICMSNFDDDCAGSTSALEANVGRRGSVQAHLDSARHWIDIVNSRWPGFYPDDTIAQALDVFGRYEQASQALLSQFDTLDARLRELQTATCR